MHITRYLKTNCIRALIIHHDYILIRFRQGGLYLLKGGRIQQLDIQ